MSPDPSLRQNTVIRLLGIFTPLFKALICLLFQLVILPSESPPMIASSSDSTKAAAHAESNMRGVVEAIGAQYLLDRNISPLMFLDVEPETGKPEHILDQAYYAAWSATMVAGYKTGGSTIRFRPAVYLNLGDNQQSWLNLNAACAAGAVCAYAVPSTSAPVSIAAHAEPFSIR